MTQVLANPADLPTRTKVFAFVLMCLGFFMATLDIQIVASSLKDIGGGLSASQDELSWVQTAYLIAEILVIPMSGWLTRVFSTRWVFAFSALGFTVTSMLCGLAWDINSMILFRGLQGALGAAMIPTVFTTAFVLFPGKQRLIASTTISALATLAPTIGPVIGGWITSQWSWHWLFYLNLVPGLAVTLLVPKYVHFDNVDLSLLKKGDYLGILLMSGFLGCLEYVLEEGPRKNWFGDDVIVTCTWIAAICGFLFIVHAFTAKEPIVDLRALAIRNFGIGSLLSFVTGIGIFCAVFLTPVFLSRVRGFDSLQIGVALLSVGCIPIGRDGRVFDSRAFHQYARVAGVRAGTVRRRLLSVCAVDPSVGVAGIADPAGVARHWPAVLHCRRSSRWRSVRCRCRGFDPPAACST